MQSTCPALRDPNSRGLGLLLRVAGIVLPFASWWVFLNREDAMTSVSPSLTRVIRLVAVPWSWPYSAYKIAPWTFGVAGLVAVVFVIVMLLRRDWRGACTALAVSLFFGWLTGMLIGQGD